MMNQIGLRNEEWISSPEPWVRDRKAVVPVPAQRAAVRAVRRFGGRDGGALLEGATAVAGWPVPAGREHPPRPRGTRARPASPTPPRPPQAPHHLPVAPISRLRPPPGRADQPVCWSDTMQARSNVLLLATAREGGGPVRGGAWRRRGRACTSCLSRRGRAGCGRPF